MKISILDVDTLGDDLDLSEFSKLGEVTTYPLTYEEDVIERIKDAEVLVLNKVKLNSKNLPYAKNLKLICITATGFDNVDIDYCKNHNIILLRISYQQDIEEEQNSLRELAGKREELLKEKNEIEAQYAADVHRREVLDRMDKMLDGYPGSVKAVMNEYYDRGLRMIEVYKHQFQDLKL